MDLFEHFERQIRYDDWANRASLRSLDKHSPQKCVRLFAHIVAAQFLWIDRMAHRPARCAVWPDWNLEQGAAKIAEASKAWADFMRGQGDASLATSVAYVNTKGEHFTSTVGDIIAHVLSHGAYHRGQIASALRDAGLNPAYTDFIHATRAHGV